jgi:hypothetical protein
VEEQEEWPELARNILRKKKRVDGVMWVAGASQRWSGKGGSLFPAPWAAASSLPFSLVLNVLAFDWAPCREWVDLDKPRAIAPRLANFILTGDVDGKEDEEGEPAAMLTGCKRALYFATGRPAATTRAGAL